MELFENVYLLKTNFVPILDSLNQWREEKRTVAWLKVPINHSRFIPATATLGFQFHHAENNSSLLKLWLKEDQPDRTPRFATHQVGVSGMLISRSLASQVNVFIILSHKCRCEKIFLVAHSSFHLFIHTMYANIFGNFQDMFCNKTSYMYPS